MQVTIDTDLDVDIDDNEDVREKASGRVTSSNATFLSTQIHSKRAIAMQIEIRRLI